MTENHEVIRAAGGFVWQQKLNDRRFAVVHRTRYGDEWTLPKGKAKKDESWTEAAKREVSEEIGCNIEALRIESFAGGIVYPVEGKPKIVLFWNMKLEGNASLKTDTEVDQVKWVTAEEAQKLLVHPKEIALIREVMNREK